MRQDAHLYSLGTCGPRPVAWTVARCLSSAWASVDFELQGGGHRLHANHAAEPREEFRRSGASGSAPGNSSSLCSGILQMRQFPVSRLLLCVTLCSVKVKSEGKRSPDGAHVVFTGPRCVCMCSRRPFSEKKVRGHTLHFRQFL